MEKSALKITPGMSVDVEHPTKGWSTGTVKSVNEQTGFASVVLPGSTRGSSYKVHDLYPAGSKASAAPLAATRSFADVKVGDTIWYDDQAESKLMLECKVLAVTPEGCDTECLQINWEAEKAVVHLTPPSGDVYGEVSVCRDNAPKIVARQAPTVTPSAPVVTPTVVAPAPAPTPAPKPVEAPVVNAVVPAPKNEVAAPYNGDDWVSGIGVNYDTLVERPRLVLGQQAKQHAEKGIRQGDLALGSLILSPIKHTGPNGLAKVGDTSPWPINFVVLFVRTGQREDIPYEETEANPQLRARQAYTQEELKAILKDTTYQMMSFSDLFLLVEKPDQITDTSGIFSVDLGGRLYAPAVTTLKRTAQDRVGAKVGTIRSMCKSSGKGGLHHYKFGMSLRLAPGKNIYATPDVSNVGWMPESARPKLDELYRNLRDAMTSGVELPAGE